MVGDRVQVLRKAKAENTYKVNSTINTRHLRSHTVKASRTLLVSLEGPGLPGGCTRLPDVGHVQTVTTDGSHGPRQHPDGLLHRDLLGAETQNSSWELGLRGLSPPSAPPPPAHTATPTLGDREPRAPGRGGRTDAARANGPASSLPQCSLAQSWARVQAQVQPHAGPGLLPERPRQASSKTPGGQLRPGCVFSLR